MIRVSGVRSSCEMLVKKNGSWPHRVSVAAEPDVRSDPFFLAKFLGALVHLYFQLALALTTQGGTPAHQTGDRQSQGQNQQAPGTTAFRGIAVQCADSR